MDDSQEKDYQVAAAYLAALAHPVRLEIVDLLRQEGELMAGTLQYTLDIGQTALSYHLRLLRQAEIVSVRHHDLQRWYRMKDPRKVAGLLAWLT
jgi:ArsR family transcriptional regulator, virulence genes transcriptional regulator